MKNLFLASVAALLLVACQQTATPEAETAAPKAVEKPVKTMGAEDIGNRGEVMMAIQAHGRPEADKQDDKLRKTAGVLQFSGVWPGMTVVELEAGSGYYTELLSRIVGKNGKVYMQNPPEFDVFLKDGNAGRLLEKDGTTPRLPNVIASKTAFGALEAKDNSADLVTWFLGPHEIFYTPEGAKTQLGDASTVYAEIYRVLKPGGKFVALDHVATGDDEAVGGTLHRIPPATVRKRAEAAGLEFVKESKLLRNGTDDHTKNVFDPEIRRKTDRFLHMYMKQKK